MKERPADPEMKDALAESEPFRALRPALVDQVFACAVERRYEPGEAIIRQGEPPSGLLVLVDGIANVVVHGHDGADHKLASVARGAVQGEMSVITDEPSTADVVAETPVRALALSVADFHKLAGRNPEFSVVLTNVVAERLGSGDYDGLGGKVLNGYRLAGCVGRGGMAVVYDATNVATGQRVALKMMSHRLVYQPSAVSRFEREARIVQGLDHPNVAKLLGIFPAFRTQFIVMEFLEGETLGALLSRMGALRPDRGKQLLGQLAAALEFVHRAGVVHRDLKPGNVMITPGDRVKLTDFGLAKEVRRIADDTATQDGVIVGTPLYMAPEQMMGEDSGAKMDVYAYCCLVYETFTGHPPFHVRSMRQLYDDKMRFRVPGAAEFVPPIPAEVHDLLVRGLVPDPDKRTDSIAEAAGWTKKKWWKWGHS